MKNFNVSVILQVESDGMICASANPMSLFIILLSLTISSTCFENDLTSRTEIVRVSSEKAFPFIMEKNHFVSGAHIQVMHLCLFLLQIF